MPSVISLSPGGRKRNVSNTCTHTRRTSLPPHHQRKYKQQRVGFAVVSRKVDHVPEIVDLTLDDEEDERKPAAISTGCASQRSPLKSSTNRGDQPVSTERTQQYNNQAPSPIQSTRRAVIQKAPKRKIDFFTQDTENLVRSSAASISKERPRVDTSTSREIASKPSSSPPVASNVNTAIKPARLIESSPERSPLISPKEPVSEFLKQKSAEEIQKLNEAFEREAMTAKEPTTPSWLGGMSLEELKKKNAEFEAMALSASGPKQVDFPYTWEEFKRDFVETGDNNYFRMEDFEESRGVTKGNMTVGAENSKEQDKAQYGRTMSKSALRVFEIGGLTASKVFVDIGHGVGNLAFQAAYTIGCESRGIELIRDRCDISEQFQVFYDELHSSYCNRDGIIRKVGKISLRHGQLEAPEHRAFLTEGVDLMFCNNFNEVFGPRSSNSGEVKACIDDYIAGLFTQLRPGAQLVTLHALGRLPHPLSDANEARKNNGLNPSGRASFYTLEILEDEGGDEKLSFTNQPFKFYKYTRVGKATFLCNNKACEYAKTEEPIQAFKVFPNKKGNRLITVVDCPKCNNSFRPKRERSRKVKSYTK